DDLARDGAGAGPDLEDAGRAARPAEVAGQGAGQEAAARQDGPGGVEVASEGAEERPAVRPEAHDPGASSQFARARPPRRPDGVTGTVLPPPPEPGGVVHGPAHYRTSWPRRQATSLRTEEESIRHRHWGKRRADETAGPSAHGPGASDRA